MLIHYEDEHIIVVQKPPKMPCQNDPTGDRSLVNEIEAKLNKKVKSHRRINLHVVHRLDRPVGGLIVYAKTPKAAHGLSEQFKTRTFNKSYLCVVDGEAEPGDVQLVHHLKKKSGDNVSLVVHKNNEGAKEARLTYRAIDSVKVKRDTYTLVEVKLETGRHHQIRVQLSAAGLPLLGDTKYNPRYKRSRKWVQIALWSHKISFIHPITDEPLTFTDWPTEEDPWTLFGEYTKAPKG